MRGPCACPGGVGWPLPPTPCRRDRLATRTSTRPPPLPAPTLDLNKERTPASITPFDCQKSSGCEFPPSIPRFGWQSSSGRGTPFPVLVGTYHQDGDRPRHHSLHPVGTFHQNVHAHLVLMRYFKQGVQ